MIASRLPWLWRALTLVLLVAYVGAASPKVTRKQFSNPIQEAAWFDDSDIVIVTDETAGIVYRSENGGTSWDAIDALGEGEVVVVLLNPFDNQVAVALGRKHRHWITYDQGNKWHAFEIQDGTPSYRSAPLVSFHAGDSKKIIINTRSKDGAKAVYTKDGFDSVKTLRDGALRCLWAKEQPFFTTSNDDQDKDRVLCVTVGKYSQGTDAQRLLMSDDFFEQEHEPSLDEGRPVQGIVSIVAAKGFILTARQTGGTTEMALYVTTDTHDWHRANFGEHQLKEGGYTVMESTKYSLQVDVSTGSWDVPPIGALFTSNSHGYNFVQNEEFTNRNREGFVDFEKVSNIQGIVLVNVVDNVEAVRENGAWKKLKTQISFDDGRTFKDIKAGDDKLHLHSVTNPSNVGRVFSSPAPGILMGIGNTGDFLKDYEEGDLWVSSDAGNTWARALSGPHKYEFGDSGSVLVAAYDKSEITKVSYSTNHGKDWESINFKDQDMPEEVRAKTLITVPDSTGLKFILKVTTQAGSDTKFWLYTIDFNTLDKRECIDGDFERWYAKDQRADKSCIMGHTQSFRRRKSNADCFIGIKFKDPEPLYDNKDCECSLVDFECDAGFRRSSDRESCVPIQPRRPGKDQCEGDAKTFKDTNGFRLIPGNECKKGSKTWEGEIERDCSESVAPPADGEIVPTFTYFPTDRFREYYYLERSGTSNELFGFPDETIVAGAKEGNKVFISHDHGKKWRQILENEEILAIYPHRHFNDRVYFITPSKTVHYSASRGKTLSKFEAPGLPNTRQLQILRFHPKNEDWLIWTSCADSHMPCTAQAHVTKKNGGDWIQLLKAVGDCEFVWRSGRKTKEELVYCAQHLNEDLESRMRLVSSQDWFDTKNVQFEDMINFATMSEFIIVAAKEGDDSQYLKVDSSIDGVTFADAKFPSNLQVPHSTAYTVLDSSTHSIFLHVTVNGAREQEYGTIIKSNSNGTSYTMSLSNVNRNLRGYVDFEKLISMEGVAVANVVANVEAVQNGAAKKLQTRITHNDGARWDSIKPPEMDADGKRYSCSGQGPEKCSLHLHGYTERADPRDTYSSASAVGFMLGIGNVGEFLGPKREGDTFISTDGGISWSIAKSGQYQWEFGDQGSIIVIVKDNAPTDVVYYSRDEGRTWKEFKFSPHEMPIHDITTVPSDTSMNFLLWGTGREGQAATVNLDFSGLAEKKCELLDPKDPNSDYTIFEPKHPFQKDNCLFGHVWQYYRKKPESTCFNGPRLQNGALFKQIRNCTCTREDFECDYNYERDAHDNCRLVPGLSPISKQDFCEQNPNAVTFYKPTGFRRLPLTTCEGGKELDISTESEACKGHEEEYKKKHGISKAGLFFAITIPILAAIGVGYWVFRKYEGQFGLGRIRLGDPTAGATARVRIDWTKYPVMVVSGAAAIVMAIPFIAGAVVRFVRERKPGFRRGGSSYQRYTNRSHFARGRDYVNVGGQDENDLLGEDSDDDA